MNNLRPDEREAAIDIERSKKKDRNIKSGFKTAGSLLTSLGGVGLAAKTLGPIASKIIPFINEYIPTDIAIKGISKISPQIGSLLKNGMRQGLDVKAGLNFIKDQIENSESKEKKDEEKQKALKEFNAKLKNASVLERETERFKNQYGQQGQQMSSQNPQMSSDVRGQQGQQGQQIPQGQQTNTDQALLAALEKILAM